MERLPEPVYLLSGILDGRIAREYIAVAFTPWRVVNFCHDRVHPCVIFIENVVEADWIHAESKVSQMGEQSYGPSRAIPSPLMDQVSD